MAVFRPQVTARSSLGDSWAVDEIVSSDSSLEEDLSSPIEQPARRQSNTSQKSPTSSQFADRRSSSHASSAFPEPELIMPSIHEEQVEASKTRARRRTRNKGSLVTHNSTETISSSKSRSNRGASAAAEIQRSHGLDHNEKEVITDQLISMLGYSAQWVVDVLGGALKMVRKPVSWVIALYLFVGLLVFIQNFLFQSIYTSLSPICRVPGVSMLGLRLCRPQLPEGYEGPPDAPVEFEQLMRVQDKFGELLEAKAADILLPARMKQSEGLVRDLRPFVRHSNLRSKEDILLELDGFIDLAGKTSWNLQCFQSNVGRGVDRVLASTHYTRIRLDDMAVEKSNRGVLTTFLLDQLLAPFQPLDLTESTILNNYIQLAQDMIGQIKLLLAEAESLLVNLKRLEDHLDTVHNLLVADNVQAQGQRDVILSQWWRSNRVVLGDLDRQLALLHHFGEWRKIAWTHVSTTVVRLQAMSAELQTLKERVGEANLLKDGQEISLAMHLEIMRLGIERLKDVKKSGREHEQRNSDKYLANPEVWNREIELLELWATKSS